MTKMVYSFAEGSAGMRELLGGKGADLAEMTKIGMRVPPGFTITTEACNLYRSIGGTMPDGLWDEVLKAVAHLEREAGRRFGGTKEPLLVSVRSGAAVSMPGMMDTVLNIGMNDITYKALAEWSGDRRFALDCYRRFLQMFGEVVLRVPASRFEDVLRDASMESLEDVVAEFKKTIFHFTGRQVPQDPLEQLRLAVRAVFESWDTPRAQTYRRMNSIPDTLGTAVNVQMMVFGNKGPMSATGVGFTRNPATGVKEYYGEYLTNAQGEDVVAGRRTPKPVIEMAKEMPEQFEELKRVYAALESHYKEMQDFEFTIEDGVVYVLQTRKGKRTAQAAVRIAVEMAEEGMITKETAILRVDPYQFGLLLHRQIDPRAEFRAIATGIPASPGAAVGQVVFTADDAVEWRTRGARVILARVETKPEDVHGFYAAEGILTSRGGKTSHAAVVARGIGKPCVSGCEELLIDVDKKELRISDQVIEEGGVITIDGTEGRVALGEVPTMESDLTLEAEKLLSWADGIRKLGVWANASMPEEVAIAKRFGAEGIGLCRTERMFNAVDRVPLVQRMILSDTLAERITALDELLPLQRSDFIQILRIMEGKPVVIRLLDIPLHEFLPSAEEIVEEINKLEEFGEWLRTLRRASEAAQLVESADKGSVIKGMLMDGAGLLDSGALETEIAKKKDVLGKVRRLVEVNPMLGHRGVRLGITYPEIYEMQVRALCEASAILIKEGVETQPHIMIPQVCTQDELRWVYERVVAVKENVEAAQGVRIPIKYGTMIEVVRACVRAGRIAEIAEFFSFGTNDLTQAVFSFSREDAENTFLPLYQQRHILAANPFETLDQKGVGRLMAITVEWGRKVRPDLKIGVCGEHGGDPRSIGFVSTIGVDYVSCSPYRVPVARLSAAQAALRKPEELSQI